MGRKQKTRRICLECGGPPRPKREVHRDQCERKREVLPSYVCSVECRDAREVKRALGQVQLVTAECRGPGVRQGALVRCAEEKLWIIVGNRTRPGWQGTPTSHSVTLRRVNAREIPTRHVSTGPAWFKWEPQERA